VEISPNLQLGDKDELVNFSDQKVKDQGHDKTKYGQQTLGQKFIFPAKTYCSIVRRRNQSTSNFILFY